MSSTSLPTQPEPVLGFDLPEREPDSQVADEILDASRRRYSVPTEELTAKNVALVAAARITSMQLVVQEQAARLNSHSSKDDSHTEIVRTAIRWGAVAAMFITFLVVMSLNK